MNKTLNDFHSPKVFTMFPNPQENFTTKTLNPKVTFFVFLGFSLKATPKNLKNEVLNSVQDFAASFYDASHRTMMEQVAVQYYALSNKIVLLCIPSYYDFSSAYTNLNHPKSYYDACHRTTIFPELQHLNFESIFNSIKYVN